ncbi:hypothetical protein QBC35DRAFT_480302 [Podospora australis]|uniref:Uncharacterized protein n=1 Tax=Podospora australis TaxID=1536484 RepID=A0AAN6X821_9PEZI|nr:hypothetical protein QBC35DRAFT_480302 [Podospora australis]
MLSTAFRTAFEAGAVAALKLRDDPSPYFGAKGSKIATAALAAAVVDTFIDKKYPNRKGGLRHTVMRQATQMAIGSLVMPAVMGKMNGGGKGKGKGGKSKISRLKGPIMGGTMKRR